MAKKETGARTKLRSSDPGGKLETLNTDLEIMEKHSLAVRRAEENEIEEMRRWDREHKDASLHSVPKPRKHMR